MAVFRVGPLPGEALEASAAFHAGILPRVIAELEAGPDHLILAFEPADQAHRGWRLAAVQALARRFAPVRVNALEGSDGDAIAAAARYCGAAEGLTGQLLPLDSNGAG